MAFFRGPSVVTDGLILYLDAANPDSYPGSGTSWFDISSGGNNGTLTNGPTFDSGNKGGILFDGINDYVNINNTRNTIVGNVNITVSFWINFISFFDTFDCFLGVNTSSGGNRFLLGVRNTGSIVVNRSGVDNITSTGIIDAGAWYNISVSNNSSGIANLVVNGIKNNEITQTLTIPFASNDTWTIGAEYDSSSLGDYINARVSNVIIYNKILTDSEILQNYNATRTRFGL
jgi:hypothetical protein